MNNEEAIKYGIEWLEDEYLDAGERAFIELALEALKQIPVITTTGEGGVIYYPQVEGVTPTVIDVGKQEPCEMTAEEYRQRMIQAFHNADTDELIAVCVLPTEKEFEHLEWLLKNHYKKEPCGNAIDRAEAIKVASGYCHPANVAKELAKLPAVNPQTCGDAIDRKLVCAFIDGLISDDREREKGLEYIRNMPPVNPQPCEDAISRQAVIDLAKKGVLVSNGNYKSVCKAINELPSVNPAKTGHWIGDAIQGEIDGQIVKGFTCSKCGAISVFRMTDGKIINGDLCANCGAKMIEPQERSCEPQERNGKK